MSSGRFDIVVVGAGMVGASAALALARAGYSVALVEAVEPPVQALEAQADFDLRVSAISPRSREVLQRYGVWSQLDAARVCYYEKMFIWHQNGQASVGFDAVDLVRDNLGAIVENRMLQQTLHRACESETLIEWFMPDRIESLLENRADGVELRLDSGRSLTAQLLIAADGRASPTRALAGIEADHGQYGQRAIVANVDTELPHRATAWQRFLSTGPLAFLPLPNGQSSIVWSCDDELADRLESSGDDEFCDALGEAFEFRLGRIEACGKRLQFPLTWHSCERWLEQRVLLIGDAAHGVHPLAGQGVNLGFSDVDLLLQLIGGPEPGIDQRRLRSYERRRKSETWVATRSFSALKNLFGIDQKLVCGLRDLGMRVVEETPWLKRSMMQKALQNLT